MRSMRLKAHRRPAVLALGVIGCDHRAEVLPRHDLLPIRQELLATGGLPVGLKGAGGQGDPAHAFNPSKPASFDHNGLCVGTKSGVP